MKTEKNTLSSFFHQIDFSWKSLRDYLLIITGGLIQAFGLHLFLVPANLVSGGISGAAQLIHHYNDWPIGMMVLVGNIPLFILGWRYLGGPRFAVRTILAILSFSVSTDLLMWFMPLAGGITDDLVLNALYGGILLGAGLGVVYLGRGTSGGTDILGRILNRRLGISISLAYMITDSLVVLAAGFVFGWERALYGLLMIYVSGVVAEVVSEGSAVIRTALIVTNHGEAISQAIMDQLERGVTVLPAKGAYSQEERTLLYCAITTSEVVRLKALVHEVDPQAFMVIGQATEALGEGFKPLHGG
jgi:uncharacterized membrane-anchored protein YitT (DUF2179 family)